MKQQTFCPECREEVSFEIKDENETTKFHGKTFAFISKEAYCNNCSSKIWVPELHDENLETFYAAYYQQ